MSEKQDGGPAFPGGVSAAVHATDDAPPTQAGMSLRDWFAGTVHLHKYDVERIQDLCIRMGYTSAKSEALVRGEKADAMLAERNKSVDTKPA